MLRWSVKGELNWRIEQMRDKSATANIRKLSISTDLACIQCTGALDATQTLHMS